MNRSIPRLALVGAALTIVAATGVAPTATAATTPEIRALQRKVRVLERQVATLRSDLNALRAVAGEVSSKVDAAAAAAAAAGQNATAAVTKTNCIVSAAALVLWSNDVYHDNQGLFGSTGLDIAMANEEPSGYLAQINPSCVGSVLPRAGQSAFRSFASARADSARAYSLRRISGP
jgi:hypothetical protein